MFARIHEVGLGVGFGIVVAAVVLLFVTTVGQLIGAGLLLVSLATAGEGKPYRCNTCGFEFRCG